MNENLVQHRTKPNVWERRPWRPDGERWLASVAAAACLTAGLRRRSHTGLWMTLAGAALAWWAAGNGDERRLRRTALGHLWRRQQPADRVVDETLLESFPTSDAPAWTGSSASVSGGR